MEDVTPNLKALNETLLERKTEAEFARDFLAQQPPEVRQVVMSRPGGATAKAYLGDLRRAWRKYQKRPQD